MRLRPRALATIGAGVAVLLGSLVGVPAGATPLAVQQVALTVDRLARNTALGTTVGIHVRDPRAGAQIVEIDADRGFIPASTMKLITAYTALRRLGPEHRFVTEVHRTGLDRVVMIGGGDPLLTSQDLRLLAVRTARALRRDGLASSVVVDFDDDIFGVPRNAPGWEAGDMPAYVSAVRGLGLIGSYSRDTSVVAASTFASHLRSQGIAASVGRRIDANPVSRRLAAFRGNQVGEAVTAMLLPSENNIAEVLFRHVALAAGQPANWLGARRAARDILRRDGFDIAGSSFVDGSGLSYRNRLTPAILTDVLARMATQDRLKAARSGLPTAGVSGTLARRFAAAPASCAQGMVVAKTGSLPMTVSTLAGLATAADGSVRVFAIMVNNRPSLASWSSTSLAIDTLAAGIQGCVR